MSIYHQIKDSGLYFPHARKTHKPRAGTDLPSSDPTPLIEPETPPCIQCRHNTTAGFSLFCIRRSLICTSSPPSFSPLPCTRSARFCLSYCPFFCWPRAGDISPRSAGAPSLRSSLLGSSSHWSAATRRTLCRCSSELLSASITRRTALRFGECFQSNN